MRTSLTSKALRGFSVVGPCRSFTSSEGPGTKQQQEQPPHPQFQSGSFPGGFWFGAGPQGPQGQQAANPTTNASKESQQQQQQQQQQQPPNFFEGLGNMMKDAQKFQEELAQKNGWERIDPKNPCSGWKRSDGKTEQQGPAMGGCPPHPFFGMGGCGMHPGGGFTSGQMHPGFATGGFGPFSFHGGPNTSAAQGNPWNPQSQSGTTNSSNSSSTSQQKPAGNTATTSTLKPTPKPTEYPQWMKELKVEDDVRDVLIKERITEDSFTELTETDFKDLGFPLGTRKTLVKAIQQLRTK